MSERDYDVPAVRKAISLIEVLCDSSQPLGITEISQRLGLNKNMVFRLIRTLTELGWVTTDHDDPLKYRMTLQPFQLASKPVDRLSVHTAALKPLRQLWEQTEKSCYLCILDHKRALCVAQMEATGDLRFSSRVGGRYFLHSTAPGKVLLAHAGPELLAQLGPEDLPGLTPHTLTNPVLLGEHLNEVLEQGYALDLMENAEGVLCYSVPIFNYDNLVVGTLGISTLTFQCSMDTLITELGPLVSEAGRNASQILGAPGHETINSLQIRSVQK